jgi:uncharacterized protein (TIGR02246 family)
MVRLMLLAVFMFALPGVAAQEGGAAAGPEQSRRTDEAAVREVVRRYVAAREERDPRAVEALFTEDADQFTTSGDWRRGRPAIVKGTQESSARNPGRRDIAVEAVRFPAPGVALVDGRYQITSGTNPGRRMWTTLLLTRGAGGWRIAAIRNTVPTGQ